jgi:hypothetical protein
MTYGIDSYGISSYGAEEQASGGSGLTVNCSLGEASAVGYTASITTLPPVYRKIACIGDSNASGRVTNNQPFTGTAYLYDNSGAVVALADPWDGGTNTYSVLDDGASADGSFVPRLAQHYHDAGHSTLWVPANKGGTQTSNWARSTLTTTHYGAMKARIDAVGGVDIISIHLGANDGIAGVSQSTFVSRMNQLITDLHGDFPSARLVLHKIQEFSGYGSQITVIRAGVQEVWDNHANVERGADFDGITTSVHYTTDADAIEVGLRTYAALEGYSVDASLGMAVADGYLADIQTGGQDLNIPALLGEAQASGFTASVELQSQVSEQDGVGGDDNEWNYYPSPKKRRQKDVKEQARTIVARAKKTDDVESIRPEATEIAEQLHKEVIEYNALADSYQREIDLASMPNQAPYKTANMVADLQNKMIDAQLQAEMAGQLVEEMDIVFVMMALLAVA